jgi:hypothetical protein
MKKKALFVMLLISIFSVCYIQTIYGISELAIEKVTGKTPEAKVEKYINAVSGGDKEQALAAWNVPSQDETSVLPAEYYDKLKAQREAITQELITKKISPNFKIKNIEWWSTCCEPHILDNSRAAGRAKLYVEFIDSKSTYIFDLSVPGGYDGGLTGHYVRNWEIDSVSFED